MGKMKDIYIDWMNGRNDNMPEKPLRPCSHAGCAELVKLKYCEKHKLIHDNKTKSSINDAKTKERHRQYDKARPHWHRLYDSKRWKCERIRYLTNNPFCVECAKDDTLKPASIVDHIIDHKGNESLFWDINNWQSLCIKHHNSKTAKENKVFGREHTEIDYSWLD